MSNGNWLKLNRELFDKPIWLNSTAEQKVVLIAILGMVNHAPMEWEWNGNKFSCKPGQKITSLQGIAEKCGKGITIQNVRTALKRFEKLEFLTNESTKQGRLITVVNWGKYQSADTKPNNEANNQLTNDQQRANNQLTTNKNNKNNKKDKNDKNTNPPISPQGEFEAVVNQLPFELRAPVNEFIEHRQEIKHPFTVRSLKMTLKKLNEYSAGDTGKSIQIIEQSIANGWQGIFPLEDKAKPRNEALDMLKRGVFNDEDGNITDINLFKRGIP